MVGQLEGKTAIVTGAARGIGLATTKLFLEEGRRVAMIDRDAPALMEAAAGLENVLPVVCDVSQPDQVTAMAAEVQAQFGRIDALVNNAGVGVMERGDILNVTEASYDRLILATGSNPFILPVPGNRLDGVIAYRDIADTETMMETAKTHKHAVVIGGGLLGCATAWMIARDGGQVLLVERDQINQHASGSNAGSLHFQLEYRMIERGTEAAQKAAEAMMDVTGRYTNVDADDNARAGDSIMARNQIRNLFRAHKHTFDFGGLIRAAHPTLDAHVGSTTRGGARHNGA